ncbi:MAG: peptidyl-prolyl cis-trans isomerase [Streptomyces sp.]|nr:peptidyl-prolyl cis-trans isomerase [Streptomyces sp.]NUR67037.1 peptidyl-prolyl cis-trans isomerase [Streptomyces sp.]
MTEHAAHIAGKAVPKSRVDAVLEAIPARDREMRPEAFARAERQRRRWATQVVVTDELAQQACAQRGLRGAGLYQSAAPPRGATSHNEPAADGPPDTALFAELGSIVATALAHSPAARTLLAELEREQLVPDEAASEYYTRNRDRFLTPDALRRGVNPFHGATDADFVPYEQARDSITAELRRAAGRRAFFDWLDQARAGVTYAPGHEHPGDPSHPDHEHRH